MTCYETHTVYRLFLGIEQADICFCSVVMRIKHLEAPVATVVKETNGSQSAVKHQSVKQISRSATKNSWRCLELVYFPCLLGKNTQRAEVIMGKRKWERDKQVWLRWKCSGWWYLTQNRILDAGSVCLVGGTRACFTTVGKQGVFGPKFNVT